MDEHATLAQPALYADDLRVTRFDRDAESALARILPTRCPGEDAMPSDHVRCACDGRGWLYPDMPASWPLTAKDHPTMIDEVFWYQSIERIWGAMGILG